MSNSFVLFFPEFLMYIYIQKILLVINTYFDDHQLFVPSLLEYTRQSFMYKYTL